MSIVKKISSARLPTEFGEFTISVYEDEQKREHVALSTGDHSRAPLVRLHSECLTGDALGSTRCDCGDQLEQALVRIHEDGDGILLYLRQEGRGIGLGNKIKAYALQDTGLDTVEANHQLGFAADERTFDVAAQMLLAEGVKKIRLMTNNPKKIAELEAGGIEIIERCAIIAPHKHEREGYLNTKVIKMGHLLQ